MDGAILVACATAATGLVASIGGIVVQLKKMEPESTKLLKIRMETAESEVGDLRDKLITSEAMIFRLKSLAAAHGWINESEITRGEDGPAGEDPGTERRRERSPIRGSSTTRGSSPTRDRGAP